MTANITHTELSRSLNLGLRLLLCCMAVTCAFSLAYAPAYAYGDVRPDDLIVDETVEDLGIDPALCPDVQGEVAICVDDEGIEYYARNADKPHKIASITKVMTSIVALENADLDTVIYTSKHADATPGSTADLREGDTLSLETALYALMVPSGNDASVAIAETIGANMVSAEYPTAEAAFVHAMNEKAAEIGCTDTYFTNPHGLDSGGYESDAHSTAHDVVIMVKYAMQDETFRTVVDAGDVDITVTDKNGASRLISLKTTDALHGVYDGLIGVKTGTGDYALNCFASAVERDEANLFTVVLGSPTGESRFTDTETMLDWTYENIQDRDFINCPDETAYLGQTYPLVGSISNPAWPNKAVDVTVNDPDRTVRIFAASGNIEQTYTILEPVGAVHAGDVMGTITFTQNGTVLRTTDLVAAFDMPAPTRWQNFTARYDRMARTLSNEPTAAPTCLLNRTTPIMEQ